MNERENDSLTRVTDISGLDSGDVQSKSYSPHGRNSRTLRIKTAIALGLALLPMAGCKNGKIPEQTLQPPGGTATEHFIDRNPATSQVERTSTPTPQEILTTPKSPVITPSLIPSSTAIPEITETPAPDSQSEIFKKCVDFMKLFKDTFHDPLPKTAENGPSKKLAVDRALELGVNNIQLSGFFDSPPELTYPDRNTDESTEQLKEWVDLIHQAGLSVTLRLTSVYFEGGEGAYNVDADPYRDHIDAKIQWLRKNITLLQNGDAIMTYPEFEGRVPGYGCSEEDPNRCPVSLASLDPEIQAKMVGSENEKILKGFLIREVTEIRNLLAEIGLSKDIKVLHGGSNGFVVAGLENSDFEGTSRFDPVTQELLGIVGMDYGLYLKDGEIPSMPYGEALKFTEQALQAPYMLVEFGKPDDVEGKPPFQPISEIFSDLRHFAEHENLVGACWWPFTTNNEGLLTEQFEPNSQFALVQEGFASLPENVIFNPPQNP